MRPIRKRTVLPLSIGVILLLFAGGLDRGRTQGRKETSPVQGTIVLAFGPGGVLTRDGTLWQFRPDKGVWLTVDDSFAEEGNKTRVHPLPVPVEQIAQMASFGFLVTSGGECWLYDLESNRWREIPPPPSRR